MLNNIVSVAQRFQRSTNLLNGLTSKESLDGYVLQPSGMAAIKLLAMHISNTNQRSFTWTGPYGCGKSSLALMLGTALSNPHLLPQELKNSLYNHSHEVKDLIDGKPWKILTLTGHKASLSDDLKKILGSDDQISDREVINQLVIGSQVENYKGTVLFIDELGKYLEGGNSDNCYFLQELAEAVNNENSKTIIIGVLHQSFEAYAARLSRNEQEEWTKVQGRYLDIPLLSPVEETVDLLSKAIVVDEPIESATLEKSVDLVIDSLKHKSTSQHLKELLTCCFPLHPVSALLLGPLSRKRFLQNTRSIFNLLSSLEPFAFQDFLKHTAGNEHLYSPSWLWDYLKSNLEQAILLSPTDAHQFILASECIERAERLENNNASMVMKTIAILDLYKRGSGIEPTLPIIHACCLPVSKADVVSTLEDLMNARLIIKRKHLNTYALYEGSDFDIEKELGKAINDVDITQCNFNSLLNLSPIVARRHYMEKGALRWFSKSIVTYSQLPKVLEKTKESEAKLILCIPDSDTMTFDELIKVNEQQINRKPLIMLGNSKISPRLKELTVELEALTKLSAHPNLEGDLSARKELAIHQSIARNALENAIEQSFTSTNWHAFNGTVFEVNNQNELAHSLSKLCNLVFPLLPTIHNELINRDNTSGTTNRARKLLMYAMVENEHKARLDITGFPPEANIYGTLLKATKFHCRDALKGWKYNISENHDWLAFWKETANYFADGEKHSLADLYHKWSLAPFGLKAGVHPVLSLLFFLANKETFAIYFNGAFTPELDQILVDHWLINPELIELRKVSFNSVDIETLQAIKSALDLNQNIDTTPLFVAREVVKKVLTCPKWALSTSIISEKTKKFRDVVIKAWDPIDLLFKDIPNALIQNPCELKAELKCAIDELTSVTPNMLKKIREMLLEELNAQEQSIDEIQKRAALIKGTSGNIVMEAFITRIEKFKLDEQTIEGIIGLACAKPKFQWNDRDIEKSTGKIAEWALKFRHLEGLAHLKNRNTNRHMISLVVAGKENQTFERVFDFSEDDNFELEKLSKSLEKLFQGKNKDLIIAALINQIAKK